jgi:DNA-binding MarR family transcriptional regulator
MYNALPSTMAAEPCLAATTRRVHRAICGIYHDKLKELGISIGQLDMLVTLLYAGAPVRPIDLAREMLMERSTVSRNLKRLEDLGLLKVLAGSTRREQLVSVTRKGRTLVFRAEARWAEAQRITQSRLGREGVRALELLSERIGREK